MNTQERVNREIDRALEEGRITGAVVLVYKDGKPLVRRAAGFADREAGTPVAFDTIFRLASVTKPIVAATALAMVDAGLIGLTDPVAMHLPWFTPKTADGRKHDITIHQLLTHTSGLVYDNALESLPEDRRITCGLSDTDLDYEANFSRHNEISLAFEPGTLWAYSFSTDILGAVIAKLHGGTLEEAVIHYVAGPLGMQDTRFHVTDPARLAVPYGDSADGPVRMGEPWMATDESGWGMAFSPNRIFNAKAFQSGGAGAAGTADDIMTFLEALRLGGNGILKPETASLGLTNRIGGVLRADPGVKFGYFGAVVEDPELAMTPQSRGTVRWGGVYGLDWFIDPVEKISSISVTNNAIEGCTGEYPGRIMRAVYDV